MIALFFEFESHEKCKIILDGQSWSVETRGIRHSIKEEVNVN
jgi:hypothetical protein